MLKFDMHVHTRHSQDAERYSMAKACAMAVEAGLSGIAFTDHFDACEAPIGYRYYLRHEAERRDDFERARSEYAGRLEVLWGVELGHPYLMPDVSEKFLGANEFDFILGSVHFFSGGRDIYLINCRTEADADEVFGEYFRDMLRLIDFGGFDSLAHLDYPLRIMRNAARAYGVRKYEPMVERVLEKAVGKGLALEINTRGLQDGRGTQEPEDWVIKRFRELGGRRITVGSDAHSLCRIGSDIAFAMAKAKELGFGEISVYRGRTPSEIQINTERAE